MTPYEHLLETASGLRRVEDGFWTAKGEVGTAFAAQAHDECFEMEEDSFWFRHRNDCIVSLVKRAPPGGVVLDVGGGNGVVTQALRQAGFPTLLVEPGLKGAQNALARKLGPVIHSSWEAARFAHGAMGAVGLFDVLEHIEDDVGFLGSVAEGLDPGACLYFTVPALPSLWSPEDESAGHFRRYTRKSLKSALARAGFELAFLSALFTPLPPAIFLARRLGWRSRTSREDHAATPSLARRGLLVALSLEASAVRRGCELPFGSSLLGLAHRRPR